MLRNSASPPQTSTSSETSIGREVHLEGNLKGKTNVRLHGTLDGDILVQGTVVVGDGGRVNGNVSADSVVVEGDVHGNIEARDRIHLAGAAKIKGNLRANRLSIEEGAWFEGRVTEQPAEEISGPAEEPSAYHDPTPVYQ